MKTSAFLIVLLAFACSQKAQVQQNTQAVAETQNPIVASELDKKYPLDKIKMPAGFSISVYAEVNNARSMVLSPNGTLFVGNRQADKVYAVRDNNGDFVADEVRVIASGLNMPCGVAFRDGSLYVAEVNRILRYDNIEQQLKSPPKPVIVSDKFPSDKHHGWKFIAFGPDGKLYVPVGAPCNICEKLDNPKYASIMRMNADGSQLEVFASGVRNSVGFDWQPETKALWFTDNGRDMLGDDLPSDELNCAHTLGMNFGYPYCHEGSLPDPEFGKKRPCSDFTAPAQKLGAHVAALGMRFYTGKQFPETYQNAAFIAQHGSWNRSSKVGYRISVAKTKGNEVTDYQTFAEGWLEGENAWGRPADVLVMPDGSLLVSDDFANVIYRITYKK